MRRRHRGMRHRGIEAESKDGTLPPTPFLWEGEQDAPSVTLAEPCVTPPPLVAGEEREVRRRLRSWHDVREDVLDEHIESEAQADHGEDDLDAHDEGVFEEVAEVGDADGLVCEGDEEGHGEEEEEPPTVGVDGVDEGAVGGEERGDHARPFPFSPAALLGSVPADLDPPWRVVG